MTPQWLDNEFRRYAHISVNRSVLLRLLTLARRCQGLSEAKKSHWYGNVLARAGSTEIVQQ